MSKLVTCVKCMIKNIHVPSFFLLLCMLQSIFPAVPVIEVDNLFSQKNFEAVVAFHKLHGNKEYSIKVVPQSSFFSSYTSFCTEKYAAFTSCFNLSSLGKTVCAGALSLGWISYVFCAYIIYRAFNLLKKIDSWIGWICDDTLLIYDEEIIWQNVYRCPQKIDLLIFCAHEDLDEQQLILERYFIVDRLLRKYNLRNAFSRNDELNQQKIRKAYVALQRIQNIKKSLLRGGGSFCQKTLS